MENNFLNTIVQALVHTLKTIFVFIFLLPYKLWVKAAKNLLEQKDRNVIEPTSIAGFWPFLTYLKRFSFDFLFDAISFLSYFIGIIVAFYNIQYGFGAFLVTLVGVYFWPIWISFFRDLFQICLIPFRKFLNWGSKPAQYLEVKNS